jgi:hypothetical protein
VVFPKIFLPGGESSVLGTDNLEAIADSALRFTLAQTDEIAENNLQHHNGFERYVVSRSDFTIYLVIDPSTRSA